MPYVWQLPSAALSITSTFLADHPDIEQPHNFSQLIALVSRIDKFTMASRNRGKSLVFNARLISCSFTRPSAGLAAAFKELETELMAHGPYPGASSSSAFVLNSFRTNRNSQRRSRIFLSLQLEISPLQLTSTFMMVLAPDLPSAD